MTVNDGFYDGEADAGSAVFTRSRLIDFIKFVPDLRQIFLRNRIACIEYGRRHDTVLLRQPHINLLVIVKVVERIAHIVCHDLFNLKFIAPHENRIIFIERNVGSFILDYNLHPGNHAFNQLDNIKTIHRHLVISEFQLIERQELLDHVIHFRGFIYNDVAVEIPAFLVRSDIVLQAFRIPLNQGYRRLKLV